MNNIYNTALLRTLVTFLLVTSFIFASVSLALTKSAFAQNPVEGQLLCSDLGSTQAPNISVVSTEALTAVPGEALTVPLKVQNVQTNSLHNIGIVAVVYAGNQVVPYDWFWVTENMSLTAETEVAQNLVWDVPGGAVAGEYRIVLKTAFAPTSGLLGSAFASGPGLSIPVTVAGEGKLDTYFDTNSLMVSGERKAYGAPVTVKGDSEVITVSMDLVNEFADVSVRGPFTLTLYDGLRPLASKVLEVEENEARLIPEMVSAKTIEFPILADEMLVVGEFTSSTGGKSVFAVPVIVEGSQGVLTPALPRVSYFGFKPAESGVGEVVACLEHGQGVLETMVEDYPVYPLEYRLSVYQKGAETAAPLVESTGSVELSSFVSNAGIKLSQVPFTSDITVRLELLSGGVVTATHDMTYTCTAENKCSPAQSEVMTTEVSADGLSIPMLIKITALLLVLLLGLLGLSLILRKRSPPTPGN